MKDDCDDNNASDGGGGKDGYTSHSQLIVYTNILEGKLQSEYNFENSYCIQIFVLRCSRSIFF